MDAKEAADAVTSLAGAITAGTASLLELAPSVALGGASFAFADDDALAGRLHAERDHVFETLRHILRDDAVVAAAGERLPPSPARTLGLAIDCLVKMHKAVPTMPHGVGRACVDLLLNPFHGTAWNVRKAASVDAAAAGADAVARLAAYHGELQFGRLIASRHRKSTEMWAHRRWALQRAVGVAATAAASASAGGSGGDDAALASAGALLLCIEELRSAAAVCGAYPRCYTAWTHRLVAYDAAAEVVRGMPRAAPSPPPARGRQQCEDGSAFARLASCELALLTPHVRVAPGDYSAWCYRLHLLQHGDDDRRRPADGAATGCTPAAVPLETCADSAHTCPLHWLHEAALVTQALAAAVTATEAACGTGTGATATPGCSGSTLVATLLHIVRGLLLAAPVPQPAGTAALGAGDGAASAAAAAAIATGGMSAAIAALRAVVAAADAAAGGGGGGGGGRDGGAGLLAACARCESAVAAAVAAAPVPALSQAVRSAATATVV